MTNQTPKHYRMLPETVRRDYERGLITVAGLLYYILKTHGKDGWKYRIDNVSEFCKEFGITRSAFYKSKAKLINDGLIVEDIIGAVELWIPNNSVIELPVNESEQVSTFVDTQSTKVDTESPKVDTQSTKVNTHPPQSQAGQAACKPSDLLQDLSHDLSQFKKNEGVDSFSLENDLAYIAWIDRGIDELPKPPKGVYRVRLRDREIKKEENQKLYQESLERVQGSVIPQAQKNIAPTPPPPGWGAKAKVAAAKGGWNG